MDDARMLICMILPMKHVSMMQQILSRTDERTNKPILGVGRHKVSVVREVRKVLDHLFV